MRYESKDGNLTINLEGRIDSNNARAMEEEMLNILKEHPGENVILDVQNLTYISSAGLRIILHIRKMDPSVKIINAGSQIYETLDITGFTEMMTVEKAYRMVSIEGCEEIGKGANGTIYRIDQDNVVKVYNNPDALPAIQHEREMAKIALIKGIPTAISYDVVRVGAGYGSVFELLNARSFSRILADDPEKLDWCVNEFTAMLKKIHSVEIEDGKLPDARAEALGWAEFVRDYIPEQAAAKLRSMIEAIPQDDHMIHGDYHTKNLELQDDEVLLIDMDTLAVGDPILEFASMFNAFVGFSESDPEHIIDFLGFDYETAGRLLNKTLAAYLGTDNEEVIRDVREKAAIIGYTRLIRRSIRRGGLEDPVRNAEIEMWKSELLELIDRKDDLLISSSLEAAKGPDEIDIEAVNENLPEVLDFVEKHLDLAGCPEKAKMQICVAAEEIFVNIANYAYAPDKGRTTVKVEVSPDPVTVIITFMDHGKPYDPLAREDPDITLSAEDRPIGGLGIFMVKKTMDDVSYEYKDGQNILRLTKKV